MSGLPFPTTGEINWSKFSREYAHRLDKVAKIHAPWGIYTECAHDHQDGEPGVEYIEEVGLVCAEGLMYRICRNCCLEPGWAEGFQLEHCATRHTHSPDGPVCPTDAAVRGVEMPDAERWA